MLSKYFKDNDFFSKLKLGNDDAALKEKLFLKMKYGIFKRNEYIFKYGDVGDIFYILIEGRVAIQLPIYDTENLAKGSTESKKWYRMRPRRATSLASDIFKKTSSMSKKF